MVELFLDIENTVIDSLDGLNLMFDNCKRIKQFIVKTNPAKVNIFTWGWATKTEMLKRLNIVTWIFDVLDVPVEKRGRVIVKEDSVHTAIKLGWLIEEDKPMALVSGMMAEFGITKPSCFIEMVSDIKEVDIKKLKEGEILESILIDDLVHETEELTYFGGKQKVKLINPMEL